jgi:hypothetical protein
MRQHRLASSRVVGGYHHRTGKQVEGYVTNLLSLVDLGRSCFTGFLLTLSLLQQCLRDQNLVLGRDGPVWVISLVWSEGKGRRVGTAAWLHSRTGLITRRIVFDQCGGFLDSGL